MLLSSIKNKDTYSDKVLVTVKLNDKECNNTLVDTGSTITFIDWVYAWEIGLDVKKYSGSVRLADSKNISKIYGKCKFNVEIGNKTIKKRNSTCNKIACDEINHGWGCSW